MCSSWPGTLFHLVAFYERAEGRSHWVDACLFRGWDRMQDAWTGYPATPSWARQPARDLRVHGFRNIQKINLNARTHLGLMRLFPEIHATACGLWKSHRALSHYSLGSRQRSLPWSHPGAVTYGQMDPVLSVFSTSPARV